MIKNYVLVSVLAAMLATSNMVNAQKVADRIYVEYAPAIAVELYENIVSKIPLSEQSQLWLANAYSHRDSLTVILIKNKKTDAGQVRRYVDSTNWAIEEEFNKTLSPSEQRAFYEKVVWKRDYPHPVFKNRIVPDAAMNSQFGTALKFRTALKLRDVQCDSLLTYAVLLRKKMDVMNNTPDSGFFDRPAFESEWMSKILTEDQYTVTLAEKNRQQCERQAKFVWHELEATKLAAKYDKSETIKTIMIYYQIRAQIIDRFANEKERRAAMLNGMKVPEALRTWQQQVRADKTKLEKYEW